MRIIGYLVVLVLTAVIAAPVSDAEDDSVASGVTEQVDVRLVMVEVVALDENGEGISDLTREDFRLTVDSDVTEIDTFDVLCGSGRPSSDLMPPEKFVLLFDYYHLAIQDRSRAIETTKEMVRAGMDSGEQIMVASLAGGLRIERRFTGDADEVVEALDRMQYDSSLFARDLSASTGTEYFEDLATLMDVLAQYDGSKAVVLFSPVLARGDVEVADFEDLAERAASARAVFYPAYARWMEMPTTKHGLNQKKGGAGGKRILSTLAVSTGGRVPPSTNDLFIAFDSAKRDMECHYGVGYLMEPGATLEGHDVRLISLRPGVTLNYPVRIRFRSDEDKKQAMLRAAFADPERFENPLVRVVVSPIRPASRKSCETIFALHFPTPSGASGLTLNLAATLAREGKIKVDEFERKIEIPDPKNDGADSQPVTVFGSRTLEAGSYTFTVALSSPDTEGVAATRVDFEVPVAPKDTAFVRGPLLSRVVPDGVRIRADEGKQPLLDRILEEGESFEPLVVHAVSASDAIIAAWGACAGTKRVPEGAMVARRVETEDGRTVHELPAVSFSPEGDSVPCEVKLDHLPAGTLEPGKYKFEVAIFHKETKEEIATQSVPLLVH